MIYILCHRGHEGLIYKGVSWQLTTLAYELYTHQLDGGDGVLIEYDPYDDSSRHYDYMKDRKIMDDVKGMVRERSRRVDAIRANDV